MLPKNYTEDFKNACFLLLYIYMFGIDKDFEFAKAVQSDIMLPEFSFIDKQKAVVKCFEYKSCPNSDVIFSSYKYV